MRYSKDVSDLISNRREIVLDKAFSIFSQRSIEEVTMVDIAKDCGFGVASVYRYFGTKLELVIAVGTKKWTEYYAEVEKKYAEIDGNKMNAAQELEFYMDSYIELFNNHKDILKFNSNFDIYVLHKNASVNELKPYCDSVALFARKFHKVYEKAEKDKTVRTDISEEDMFYTIMYTMLTTAAKYSIGIIYPLKLPFDYKSSLLQLKRMLLNYYCK